MKAFSLFFTIILLLNSCGKKNSEDFFIMQSGDYKLSCQNLKQEINLAREKISKLEEQQNVKIVKNTSLFYLAIPTLFTSLFFVDFSKDDENQISLHKNRISHLEEISKIKNCY